LRGQLLPLSVDCNGQVILAADLEDFQ
jgi:hypothetical protein